MIWKVRERVVTFDRTLVMGIVNVTPDSFSDGGKFLDPERAAERALELVAEGADMLDFGAESTRPGAELVAPKEELARLLPVLENVRAKVQVLISVDTQKPEVAKQCLERGADIVNDVSGLRESGKKMAGVVRTFGAGIILMHSRGTPRAMQTMTHYDDLMGEIQKELAESVELALKAGVGREQIVIDPGIGFAKTASQNLEILKQMKCLKKSGYPVLVGPSRKSFIGGITGRVAEDRDFGTAACVAACVTQGVQIVRVHNVKAARDVIAMTEAIHSSSEN